MLKATWDNSSAYVNQMSFGLSRQVSYREMESALELLCDAHPILRTSFFNTSDGMYQYVQPKVSLALSISSDLQQYCQEDLARGFHIKDLNLFRFGLIGNNDDGFSHAVLTIHHVLYDGWCLPALLTDLSLLCNGQTIESTPPFKSVIQHIAAQDPAEGQDYWTKYLGQVEPFSWTQRESVPDADLSAVVAEAQLSISNLNQASSRAQITLSTLTKAAWALTLQLYTQQKEALFGTVVSGRDMPIPEVER
ncbi:MAG: hypothetical protein EAZ92_00870 [Candidatus Kapaibacterium sp.]|nr:MAG: hypothetical protein EAZ92_00870 [Candidatus Kapabacteria bacterium]